jgi:hypothetical protein
MARMASGTEELFCFFLLRSAQAFIARGVKGARPWNFHALFNTK